METDKTILNELVVKQARVIKKLSIDVDDVVDFFKKSIPASEEKSAIIATLEGVSETLFDVSEEAHKLIQIQIPDGEGTDAVSW